MGKKWEAILAKIFVVGGRFPQFPAMRTTVNLSVIKQLCSGSLASKPTATSSNFISRTSTSLTSRPAAVHSTADRLATASMPIVDFEQVIKRTIVDNLAASSTNTSKLHQLCDTSTNQSSVSSTITSRVHQLGATRIGLSNLPPPVASSRLQPSGRA